MNRQGLIRNDAVSGNLLERLKAAEAKIRRLEETQLTRKMADRRYGSGVAGTPGGGSDPVMRARVYNSVGIDIINNTSTQLTFDSERYDVGDFHETVINPGHLTIPADGLYAIGASVGWQASTSGYRSLSISHPTAGIIAWSLVGATSIGVTQIVGTQWYCTTGDFLRVFVRQTSGSTLQIAKANSYSPEFYIVKLD